MQINVFPFCNGGKTSWVARLREALARAVAIAVAVAPF